MTDYETLLDLELLIKRNTHPKIKGLLVDAAYTITNQRGAVDQLSADLADMTADRDFHAAKKPKPLLKAYSTCYYKDNGKLYGSSVIAINEEQAKKEIDSRGLGEILDGEIVAMMDEDEGKMHHT